MEAAKRHKMFTSREVGDIEDKVLNLANLSMSLEKTRRFQLRHNVDVNGVLKAKEPTTSRLFGLGAGSKAAKAFADYTQTSSGFWR